VSARVGVAILIAIGVCAALVGLGVWWRWPLIIVFVLLVAGSVRRVAPLPATGYKLPAIFFYAATLVLLIGYALFATLAPPSEFDFLADWGAKGRAFWEARAIDWRFLETATYRATHPDYPLLVPLTFDAVAVVRGAWDARLLGMVNVVFAAALLLVVHGVALAELRRRDAAAFIAFAVLPLAAVPWIGIGEGAFIAYGTAALLLIRRGDVLAGAVLLGLAASSKNEGLALIVAAALALVVARRARDVLRLWPAAVIPLPWLILRWMHALPTDVATGNVLSRMFDHLRDPAVFVELARYPLGKPLFWLGLLAGVWFARREKFVLTAIGLQLLFYLAAYLATPHDVAWHVKWSWERLIAHLAAPLAVVVLINLLRDALDERRALY